MVDIGGGLIEFVWIDLSNVVLVDCFKVIMWMYFGFNKFEMLFLVVWVVDWILVFLGVVILCD